MTDTMSSTLTDEVLSDADLIEAATTPAPEAAIITVEDSKAALAAAIIAASAQAVEAEEAAVVAVATLDQSGLTMASLVRQALAAGHTYGSLADALKADAKATGTPHPWQSAAALTYVDTVGRLLELDGEMPEGFVIRREQSAVALAEGQQSLLSLVKYVCRQAGPAGAILKAAKVPHGKAALLTALDACETREEGVATLLKMRDDITAALAKAAAEAEQQSDGDDSDGGSETGPAEWDLESAQAALAKALTAATNALVPIIEAANDPRMVADEAVSNAVAELTVKAAALMVALGLGDSEAEAE